MADRLSLQERKKLLEIARQAIRSVVEGVPLETIDLAGLPMVLREEGVSFVTLTIAGQLRGCIGALEAYQPLALDVQEHAVAAATEDYRFPPVGREELPLIEIEISRLTPMRALDYSGSQDLLDKLRPGVDGVVIRDGMRRATFLPALKWARDQTSGAKNNWRFGLTKLKNSGMKRSNDRKKS